MAETKRKSHNNNSILFFYVALISLFLKPGILSYAEQYRYYLPSLVPYLDYAFELLLAIVSLIAIMKYSVRVKWDKRYIYLVAMMLVQILSLLYAQSGSSQVDWTPAIRSIEYIAMALLVCSIWKNNRILFLKSLIILLGILSMANIASIVLTNGNGFVPGMNQAGKIFFFGGKNSILFTGIAFIAVLVAYNIQYTSKTIQYFSIVASVVYVALSFVLDSSSSLFFFLLITVVIALSNRINVFKASSVRFACICVLIVLLLIVLFPSFLTTFASPLLEAFGRDATFSGRIYMWQDALNQIGDNFIFGTGGTLDFRLSEWTSSEHAHSYYLTCLAQYGILYFILFLLDINAMTKNKKNSTNILVIIAFILLFHSVFDDLNFFYYVLVTRILLLSSESKKSEALYQDGPEKELHGIKAFNHA